MFNLFKRKPKESDLTPRGVKYTIPREENTTLNEVFTGANRMLTEDVLLPRHKRPNKFYLNRQRA